MPSTTSWPASARAVDLTENETRALLRQRLGRRFDDDALFTLALAHRSWCAENPGTESNERLEFLGDAVLGLVVTDHLFGTYTSLAEGELAKVRAAVVNAGVLAELAAELGIGPALALGKGEDACGSGGGRSKKQAEQAAAQEAWRALTTAGDRAASEDVTADA